MGQKPAKLQKGSYGNYRYNWKGKYNGLLLLISLQFYNRYSLAAMHIQVQGDLQETLATQHW